MLSDIRPDICKIVKSRPKRCGRRGFLPEICLSWIKTTHTMKRLFRYLGPVLLCFAVGFSASLFQARAIAEWYPALVKPR